MNLHSETHGANNQHTHYQSQEETHSTPGQRAYPWSHQQQAQIMHHWKADLEAAANCEDTYAKHEDA